MRGTARSLGIGLAVLMTLLLMAPAAAWQGTPAPVTEPPVGVLAEVEVDRLPSTYMDTRATPAVELPAAAEVWFLRLTLDPDGYVPPGLQIGPTVLVVESGALTVDADGPVKIGAVGTEPVAGDAGATVVETGQAVNIPEDTTIALRNAGDAPVTVLALLVFSPYREVIAMEEAEAAPMEEPRGLARQQPLGVTQAAFPDGPGVVTLERVALEAGASEAIDVPGGAAVGGVEQGSASVAVERGECLLWPAMMAPPTEGEQGTPSAEVPMPRREQLRAGGSAELAQDDAFGCQDVAATWTAGDEGATIIRASVMPVGGTVASPVAQTEPPAATGPQPMGVLAEADIPVLPSPDAEVWLVRYELAPGGILPSQSTIGPMLALVESGELTLISGQPMERLDDPAATGSGEMVLAPGAAVSIPDGATIEARNDGDAPAVFLMLMAFTPEREMAAMEAESTGDPVGLTVLGLAVTHGAFPEGPGQIRIGRLSAPAGATVPYQSRDTAVTMLVEQGGGTLTVADGVCGVFPPMETNSDVIMVGPEHPEGVDSAELTAGSGLGCGESDATVLVGPDGMTVLFAEVTPAER